MRTSFALCAVLGIFLLPSVGCGAKSSPTQKDARSILHNLPKYSLSDAPWEDLVLHLESTDDCIGDDISRLARFSCQTEASVNEREIALKLLLSALSTIERRRSIEAASLPPSVLVEVRERLEP